MSFGLTCIRLWTRHTRNFHIRRREECVGGDVNRRTSVRRKQEQQYVIDTCHSGAVSCPGSVACSARHWCLDIVEVFGLSLGRVAGYLGTKSLRSEAFFRANSGGSARGVTSTKQNVGRASRSLEHSTQTVTN